MGAVLTGLDARGVHTGRGMEHGQAGKRHVVYQPHLGGRLLPGENNDTERMANRTPPV
jgi:hypothetical protein